jgi:hypothetical protein
MKTKLLVLASVAAVGLFATSAFAAEVINITAVSGNTMHHAGIPGETLITDFNTADGTTINDVAPGFTFTQNTGAFIRDGNLGLAPGVSAPPPEDNGGPVGSWYETVSAGGTATLTSLLGLRQFSFYMGSPDTFNQMVLTFTGAGGTQTLNGTQIWGGAPPGDGNQSNGFTVTYTFAPDAVNMIQFNSSQNAFEFDTLGGIAVPEPASWALMLGGFGLAGGMLRAMRRKAALA